jgi:hypothetical protein
MFSPPGISGVSSGGLPGSVPEDHRPVADRDLEGRSAGEAAADDRHSVRALAEPDHPFADRFGHAMFQRILEDIADTDFTGDETDRITLLSHIDRVAVGARAELGRLLL